MGIRLCRFTESFYPYPGGISTHVTELSKKINPHLETQIIMTPLLSPDKGGKKFDFEVHYVRHRIKSGRLFKSILYFFSDLPCLIKTIKEEDIDLIHAHSWRPGIVATLAGRLTSTPVIWTIHGVGPYRLRQDVDPKKLLSLKRKIFRFRFLPDFMDCANTRQKLRLLFSTAPIIWLFQPDKIFTVQDGTSSEILLSFLTNREKVVSVYHGIEIPDEEHIKKVKARATKNIGEKFSNKFIIITTSRFVEGKGLEYAILTLKKLKNEFKMSNATLIMIGHGILEEKLRAMTEEYGLTDNVIFTGPLDKAAVEEYLSIADVYLGTGTYGNRNNATMEAMAYRVPVVLFHNRWDDYPDGSVISVQPMDYDAMAEAVFSIYKDEGKKEKLINSALHLIRTQNSWNRRIETELGEYKKLLDKERTPKNRKT